MTEKVKVGVTLRVNGEKGKQSLWENGIFQNCIFLCELFAKAPHVSESYLVLAGSADQESRKHFMRQTKCKWMNEDEAAQKLDVIIEMSISLTDVNTAKFLARGGKLVAAKVGNDYVIDTERILFGLDPASLVRNFKYAATWTIEEYRSTGVDYFATLGRAPVKILPHLWSPTIMANALLNHKDMSFVYQPGMNKWTVAMFEPNICMVKTSAIPLLVCEHAHRLDKSMLSRVLAFNTAGFVNTDPANKNAKGAKVFSSFVNNLDINTEGIVSYEQRLATFEVMSKFANAVVCHQLENAQNYLYYELLWGGYPLIHNSPLLKDVGYYYPDFDCEEGGMALLRAFHQHDKNLEEYKVKAMNFIASLDPLSQKNILAYDEALVEVINSK